MSWRDDLRPASWRNVRFQTWHADGQFGRRVAPHEYPYRDEAWVEDLGRGLRRISIVGYIEGEDVLQQQDRMLEAAEREGVGELMHPTLGLMSVSLVNLSVTARYDLGRVLELSFQFLSTGAQAAPDASTSGLWDVLEAAGAADQASAASYLGQARATLAQGATVARQAQDTVRGWTSTARRVSLSARAVLDSVGSLVPGRTGQQFSRFLTGSRSPLAVLDRTTNSVDGKLRQAASARLAVTQAASDVETLAGRL